jgi:hypothetical protein
MMCDLRSKGDGLRQGSQAGIWIATLVASQLLFACVWAAAQSPKINSHTAIIDRDVDVPNTSGAQWCYDTEPAFVFSKDRTVFRYDTSGKLLWQTSAPWEMGVIGNVSCSNDGKVLYFANYSGTRLSIYSSEDGLSEYEMSVPHSYSPSYSLMSADGSTFALPSAPSLISGKDVLRNKRVVQTGGQPVFWTKDILFVQTDEYHRFRMLRSGDLSDRGVLSLNPRLGVQGIFECGKSYFVLYSKDASERNDLEWINDRRLQSGGAPTRFENVGVVEEFGGSCTVSLEHVVAGGQRLKSAVILEDRVQERLEFRNTGELSSRLSVSRDRRLILGIHYLLARPGDVAHGGTPSRVVVLRIKR